MITDPTRRWTLQDALETYGLPYWGKGQFGINEKGHVTVHPSKSRSPSIDIKEVIDILGRKGIHPPVLLRFSDLVRERLGEIAGAFRKAIEENSYQGKYLSVYPIKVNQARQVVEEICDFGLEHGFGLEAGSKPELLAVLALTGGRKVPVVCNGFKDDEYIEMVILAQKFGQQMIPVVEKFSELKLIVKYAEKHKIKPILGVRVKLAARGIGRWELSGGMKSKFGLFVPEVIDALEYLRERDLTDSLKLLHFHLGSQITHIRNVKNAVAELARVYVEVKRAGAGLEYIDVGGGLGVDYDGSQTSFPSSMNYTLEEYASDVVYRVMSVCDDAEVEHPTIVTECGRAMVASHAALVFNVLGASRFDKFGVPDEIPIEPENEGDEEPPQPLIDLQERLRDLTHRNAIEYYHDALQSYEEALNSFTLGYLDLEQRAIAERLFWAICLRVLALTRTMARIPEELEGLQDFLADIYFCNFSVFQSMPDSWAINQLFPVVPIHRLSERPTRRGVLADITCDSDGKVDKFTHLREEKHTLELHTLTNEPYYIGAFLIGAYQEILGDLHNLFGDTHAVHVSVGEDGKIKLDHIIEGDTVREVLEYVQYSPDELFGRLRAEVGRAVESGQLQREEGILLLGFYQSGLSGYTYLEADADA